MCGIIDNLIEGKNKIQKLRMTQILTWKPELGKTTWSPQTPKQITIMEEEYNEKLAGSNLEVSFVNRRLWSHTLPRTLFLFDALLRRQRPVFFLLRNKNTINLLLFWRLWIQQCAFFGSRKIAKYVDGKNCAPTSYVATYRRHVPNIIH